MSRGRGGAASLVLDRLYIGGEDDTTSDALAALNITHVVNCTANLPFFPHPASAGTPPVEEHQFRVGVTDVDSAMIDVFFHPAAGFISDALASSPDAKVLVHCHAGKVCTVCPAAHPPFRTLLDA